MTTYFSQYEKTALQNNIRRKEDQVQALRYGNAMRSAVSIDMMYMFITMFHKTKSEFYYTILKICLSITGIDERPLRKAPKIQLSIGDEAEQLSRLMHKHLITLTL